MYRTKAQYDRSNTILTEMLSSPGCQDVLSNDCIKAIENFKCFMIKQETYLAFYVRKIISMSFDSMTTSPVESMNSSIKNCMGVNSNSNTRWVVKSLCHIYEFIYYMNLLMFLQIIHEFGYNMNSFVIRIRITYKFIELISFPVFTQLVHSLMTLLSILTQLTCWWN